MKKNLKIILAIAFASVVVTACKKKTDDPNPGNNNNNNSSIEGTWNMDSMSNAAFVDDSLVWSSDTAFTAGSFEIFFNGNLAISKNVSPDTTDYDTVAYFISNSNKLNIVFESDTTFDTVQYTFTITNSNKLNLHYEETYEDMGEMITETQDMWGTRK